MKLIKNTLKNLPSVDSLLKNEALAQCIARHGRDLTVHGARAAIDMARKFSQAGEPMPSPDELVLNTLSVVKTICSPSLRPIVNATGIVLHTNLGRAVLGKKVLDDITPIVLGYSTIEFDRGAAARGSRHDHVAGLLKYLTHAENAIVVNNNAAAIVLALSTLAKKKEVIVSRGELIEIGGEFRIPDIMAASGARMIEVGTTNRTRIADYEKAITERTAVLFKAHKSNFSMNGFVEEASIKELSQLARKRGLLVIHDIGSGLIRKPKGLPLDNEPDVASSIENGADLVLFSADKLLGGPQAGIAAGRSDLVARMAKAPLMRALRVGKLTLAALISACGQYLDDKQLIAGNPTFFMLSRGRDDLRLGAETLQDALAHKNIKADLVETMGQCGGGTLPDVNLPGFAVKLQFPGTKKAHANMAEAVFKRLLARERPILGILREGSLLFDLRTVDDKDIPYLAEAIAQSI
jgi:L-seryl-tRNA(Ser) seleniumtransferase